MKDAFDNDLEVGDKVIYSVKGGGGTEYVVGVVEEMQPCQPKPGKSYYPPDRVIVKPVKTTRSLEFSKNPVLYASNVVAIAALAAECSSADTSPGDCSDL